MDAQYMMLRAALAMVKLFQHPGMPVDVLRVAQEGLSHLIPHTLPYQRDHLTLAGVPVERITARPEGHGYGILYLHGGAYALGPNAAYSRFASHLAHIMDAEVLMPDYRLAPENPFPAAIEDCIRVAEVVLRTKKNVILMGDSAGGGLVLATLLALRDRGVPLPRAAVTFSAFTDLAVTGESIKTLAAQDPVIEVDMVSVMANHYLADADPQNPLASPLYGAYHGLPPLMMQVGSDEVLLDDTLRVAEKARAAGGRVRLEVVPSMFHVFQLAVGFLPQADQALISVRDFIHEVAP
ncbi:MAG: alpha/beta hydrolase [Holosporales bacterium]